MATKKIFKFESEKQLDEFDAKYNYNGVLSCEESVWIYGEGTDRWFSIQYCGDRWCLNYKDGDFKKKDIYPTGLSDLEWEIDGVFFFVDL